MTGNPMRFGFRVVGDTSRRRRLVDAAAALAGYAACDPLAEVDREGYLSAFCYGDEFREHLKETGSTRGFDGPCGAAILWLDIDHPDDSEKALTDARQLGMTVLDRYPALDEDDLLLFFSGSKGYHCGLPTFWAPPPSVRFHRATRHFAEMLAAAADVTIDLSVYDKVRCFRAPNSKHPKTGLHKRRLSVEELLHLTPTGIRELAAQPVPFDLPVVSATCAQAVLDWEEAVRLGEVEAEAKVQRRTTVDGSPRLNRQTLETIRDGTAIAIGNRHRLLFSAAANLAEFGCPAALAHALLTEAGLDSGLPPKEVHRQIECGLSHAPGREEGNGRA